MSRSRLVAMYALALGALLVVASCLPGTQGAVSTGGDNMISAVLIGLWHGLLAPLTLIGEFINRFFPGSLPWNVHMYETALVGPFYDLGFYLGLAGFWLSLQVGLNRRSTH